MISYEHSSEWIMKLSRNTYGTSMPLHEIVMNQSWKSYETRVIFSWFYMKWCWTKIMFATCACQLLGKCTTCSCRCDVFTCLVCMFSMSSHANTSFSWNSTLWLQTRQGTHLVFGSFEPLMDSTWYTCFAETLHKWEFLNSSKGWLGSLLKHFGLSFTWFWQDLGMNLGRLGCDMGLFCVILQRSGVTADRRRTAHGPATDQSRNSHRPTTDQPWTSHGPVTNQPWTSQDPATLQWAPSLISLQVINPLQFINDLCVNYKWLIIHNWFINRIVRLDKSAHLPSVYFVLDGALSVGNGSVALNPRE